MNEGDVTFGMNRLVSVLREDTLSQGVPSLVTQTWRLKSATGSIVKCSIVCPALTYQQ